MFHHNFTGHSILIQSKGNIWLRKPLNPWPAIFRTFLRFLRHWACPGQGNGNGSSIPWCQPTSIIQPAIGRRRVTARSGDTLEIQRFMITCTVIMTKKNRWIMISIINWSMELSAWLFIMTNLHGTIVSTFSKCSVPPRPAVQVGQLFNLFERDLDSMEEDLGTSGSDRGNALAEISCGDITSGMSGFYGDVTP